ncbi:hypothetical protein DRP07_04005, partial [Archaeoglobales archaeon]
MDLVRGDVEEIHTDRATDALYYFILDAINLKITKKALILPKIIFFIFFLFFPVNAQEFELSTSSSPFLVICAVIIFVILVLFIIYRNYYSERELRRREEEIMRSEEKYRELFENSLDTILITNLKGEFIEVNKAFERVMGYSKEEVIGRSYRDFIPEEYTEFIFKSFNRAFKAGKSIYGLELEFFTKNRERRYAEGNISLIKQGGKVVAFQGNFRDVTERKRMEEKLKDSEEMFRKLAEKSLVGIYLIQDGVFRYVNPKMAELWGYGVEELIGRSPLEF